MIVFADRVPAAGAGAVRRRAAARGRRVRGGAGARPARAALQPADGEHLRARAARRHRSVYYQYSSGPDLGGRGRTVTKTGTATLIVSITWAFYLGVYHNPFFFF